VEVETNGTLAPIEALRERVNQWNVSPKLANSSEPLARRIRPTALAAFSGTNAWLKLVVASAEEGEEIETLLAGLRWPRDRVGLQAAAATRSALRRLEPAIRTLSSQRGLAYSRRLHVELWDGERGR
jgi:hypothetical protein